MGLGHLSLRRITAIVVTLLFVDCLPGDVSLNYSASPFLLLDLLWLLLYVFSCRRSFLLIFRSFSLIVLCSYRFVNFVGLSEQSTFDFIDFLYYLFFILYFIYL